MHDEQQVEAKAKDGRILANNNEEEVLWALHRFGWLPTRHLAAYVWPTATSVRVAQRTMARLRESGEVCYVRGEDGSTVYYLSASGVRRVKRVYGVEAKTFKDMGRRVSRNYGHRNIANGVVIWWRFLGERGGRFETEHEILSKKATINKKGAHLFSAEGKVPDALVFMDAPDDNGQNKHQDDVWVGWVEAECGYKNWKKQLHLVAELAHILGANGTQMTERRLREDGTICSYRVKFALVACPEPTHELRLVRSMLYFLCAVKNRSHFDANYVLAHTIVWRLNGDRATLQQLIDSSEALRAYEKKLRLAK
jgi:hypothetical protein